MKSLFSLLLVFSSLLFFSDGLSAQSATTAPPTLGQLLENSPNHTVLAKALETAGLAALLNEEAGLTLLAPSDAAFAELPGGVLESLLTPENREKLTTLLRYHLLDTDSEEEAMREMGDRFPDGVNFTDNPAEAANGRIFFVDRVLLPPGMSL